jgi:hypothetical protein
MKTLLLKYLMVALSAALLLLTPLPKTAHACTKIRPDKPITAADRTIAADVVFEGTVISTTMRINTPPPGNVAYSPTTIVAVINVHQYLKGTGPATLTVDGFSDGSQLCAPTISVGTHAIFYTTGDLALDPSLHYRNGEPVDRWTIVEIKAAAANQAAGNLISHLTVLRDPASLLKAASLLIFTGCLSFICWRVMKRRIPQSQN